MSARRARFNVGQIVSHRRAGYRGVVYDVDPTFSLDDAWYNEMARSRPPKDKPWYSGLVNSLKTLQAPISRVASTSWHGLKCRGETPGCCGAS